MGALKADKFYLKKYALDNGSDFKVILKTCKTTGLAL